MSESNGIEIGGGKMEKERAEEDFIGLIDRFLANASKYEESIKDCSEKTRNLHSECVVEVLSGMDLFIQSVDFRCGDLFSENYKKLWSEFKQKHVDKIKELLTEAKNVEIEEFDATEDDSVEKKNKEKEDEYNEFLDKFKGEITSIITELKEIKFFLNL